MRYISISLFDNDNSLLRKWSLLVSESMAYKVITQFSDLHDAFGYRVHITCNPIFHIR